MGILKDEKETLSLSPLLVPGEFKHNQGSARQEKSEDLEAFTLIEST